MELEELLKEIGGKESSIKIPGLDYSVNGVCATWCLEDIKGDGVSYNLFKKSMWRNNCAKLVGIIMPFAMLMKPNEIDDLKIMIQEISYD